MRQSSLPRSLSAFAVGSTLPRIPSAVASAPGQSSIRPRAPINALRKLWFLTKISNTSKTMGEFTGTGEGSMRHQYRHRQGSEDVARHASEDEFAQARMAIAAEHHGIGAGRGGVREDRARDVDAAGRDALEFASDAVA